MNWESFVNQLRMKWGLSEKSSGRFAELVARLQACGIYTQITSGWRDPIKQGEMLARWNSGDREGLRCKPSDPTRSLHCHVGSRCEPASDALDIVTTDESAAAEIAEMIGLEAGYRYTPSDGVHFAFKS